MNAAIVLPLLVPAAIATYLLALVLKDLKDVKTQRSLLRKEGATQVPPEGSESESQKESLREYYKQVIPSRKRFPEDFLDLTGGAMGI